VCVVFLRQALHSFLISKQETANLDRSRPAMAAVDLEDTGAPLPSLYARAEALHRQLENSSLGSGSDAFQAMVKRGHRLLREAYRRAVSTGLFSANEEGDDMHTNDIKLGIISGSGDRGCCTREREIYIYIY
jgi:TAP42-like family